jgi:CBS domain-containing protein
MLDAIAMMGEKRISELPVTDQELFPIGMIDITDVVAAFPECTESVSTLPSAIKIAA